MPPSGAEDRISFDLEIQGLIHGPWTSATSRGLHMTAEGSVALAQLIAILESARGRKPMYFSPVEPKAVEYWLGGLRAGCSLAGLEWSPEHCRPALERRGLKPLATWETEQLTGRGLGPEAIVDELLAIEVEMWQHAGGLDAGWPGLQVGDRS